MAKLTDRILELPDDANILVQHDAKRRPTDIRPKNPVTFKMDAAELKSLARSHKDIIAKVRAYLSPQPNDAQSERVHNELVKAVEEAERCD